MASGGKEARRTDRQDTGPGKGKLCGWTERLMAKELREKKEILISCKLGKSW